ncbi:hypothetical protein QBC34DRAFT_193368 [Podospora aff. communis PSN243]|uniref:Uncharacterized protein n=1 Tax=Podospora aff. communis PSN243 TaxID=3040156 RepID=A0AAV9H180_9PEZI|nr:hypothetical protein QBC34DRAFT_193368 [Podospora aff. communis PSN243]
MAERETELACKRAVGSSETPRQHLLQRRWKMSDAVPDSKPHIGRLFVSTFSTWLGPAFLAAARLQRLQRGTQALCWHVPRASLEKLSGTTRQFPQRRLQRKSRGQIPRAPSRGHIRRGTWKNPRSTLQCLTASGLLHLRQLPESQGWEADNDRCSRRRPTVSVSAVCPWSHWMVGAECRILASASPNSHPSAHRAGLNPACGQSVVANHDGGLTV